MRRGCVFVQLYRPGLGDMVQRNILLSLLARAWPQASITLVLGESLARRFADLIRDHLYAADVLTCPDPGARDMSGWARCVRKIASRRFELCVVDPGTVALDARHARLAGIGWRVARPRGRPSDVDITHPVRAQASAGRPDLYDYTRAFAAALGVKPPRPMDVVPPLPRQVERVAELAAPRPRVGVHPGGRTEWNRRWPLDRYAELCVRLVDRLGASLYLVGDDREAGELGILRGDILQRCPAGVVHVNVDRSLNRMANLLAGLDVLVGNDSGPAHLAAAVGAPTVVIYGPSGAEVIVARVYQRHRAVSLRYPCQSISHEIAEGRVSCEHACAGPYAGPRGRYPRCLEDIDVDRVEEAVVAQLRAPAMAGGGAHVR